MKKILNSLLFLLLQVEIFSYNKIKKVTKRQHDPYRLHTIYRNGRPILAHTKEWVSYEFKKDNYRRSFERSCY